jgi:hypothetical protein
MRALAQSLICRWRFVSRDQGPLLDTPKHPEKSPAGEDGQVCCDSGQESFPTNKQIPSPTRENNHEKVEYRNLQIANGSDERALLHFPILLPVS